MSQTSTLDLLVIAWELDTGHPEVPQTWRLDPLDVEPPGTHHLLLLMRLVAPPAFTTCVPPPICRFPVTKLLVAPEKMLT